MMRALAAAAAALLLAAAPALDGRYENARFGYVLRYPTRQLVPEPESDNGDGRVFVPRKGGGEVLVWGAVDFEGLEPHRATRAVLVGEGYAITLDRAKGPWFVLSGRRARDGAEVYHKGARKPDGAWCHLRFEYPRAARAAFVPLIEAMAPRFPGE